MAGRTSRVVTELCFFFFQAEDGIRDLTVTGVQTCALPLVDGVGRSGRGPDREGGGVTTAVHGGEGRGKAVEVRREPALWGLVGNTPLIPLPPSTALHRPPPRVFLKAAWPNPGGAGEGPP